MYKLYYIFAQDMKISATKTDRQKLCVWNCPRNHTLYYTCL